MLRLNSAIGSVVAGILACNPDTGAPVGAVDAPEIVTVPPVKRAPAKRKAAKRAPKIDDNPLAYSAPDLTIGAGFTAHANAFDEIERLTRVQRDRKEKGLTNCRAGWTRAIHVDVAERESRPVIVVRGGDLCAAGASRTKPASDVEGIYNDDTGAPRAIIIGTYPKSGAKDAQKDCDALNAYFGARFGRTADRISPILSNSRAVQLLALTVAVMGNDPQRAGRYGAVSAKTAAREAKKIDSATKTIERLKSSNNPALAAALAKIGIKIG